MPLFTVIANNKRTYFIYFKQKSYS